MFFSTAAQKPIILHYNAVSKVPKTPTFSSTHSSQGEIVQSDRMDVMVGGSNAMAALVEGTTELVATDGQGDAGEFQFLLICVQRQLPKRSHVKLSFLPPTASMVSSAEIPLTIDHTVSPSLKLVVYVNEVITSVWMDPSLFLL